MSKAILRADLKTDGLSVPVGQKYWDGVGELECRWVTEDDFEVFFEGRWQEAQSIDFDFPDGEEATGEDFETGKVATDSGSEPTLIDKIVDGLADGNLINMRFEGRDALRSWLRNEIENLEVAA